MRLALDYTQRLNLHALMGAQRASVDELRMFWRLQDMINLTPEERDAIGYKTSQVGGQVQVQWDSGKNLPVQEYEFKDDEFQRLSKMVREGQSGFLIGADRIWLEPLLAQFDGGGMPPTRVNGQATNAG